MQQAVHDLDGDSWEAAISARTNGCQDTVLSSILGYRHPTLADFFHFELNCILIILFGLFSYVALMTPIVKSKKRVVTRPMICTIVWQNLELSELCRVYRRLYIFAMGVFQKVLHDKCAALLSASRHTSTTTQSLQTAERGFETTPNSILFC